MSNQGFYDTLQQLKDNAKDGKEIETLDRSEVDCKRDAIIETRKSYLRCKVENDQLENELELNTVRRGHQHARGARYLDKIQKETCDKTSKMDAVLNEFKAENLGNIEMVVKYYRDVADIPQKFSEEALRLKNMEFERKLEEMADFIRGQKNQIKETGATAGAVLTLRNKRNDALDAFAKEMKSIIIVLDTELRRRKLVHK